MEGAFLDKFRGVLFVADYDDTLLNSQAEITPENRDAIEYFVGNGGIFTVSTGRAFLAFKNHIGKVPINAPVVLSNGAMIFDFQKNVPIFNSFLPQRVQCDCRKIISAFPDIGLRYTMKTKFFRIILTS
jgi:HAD superfamily hydrolase (TIGR01484 family)